MICTKLYFFRYEEEPNDLQLMDELWSSALFKVHLSRNDRTRRVDVTEHIGTTMLQQDQHKANNL